MLFNVSILVSDSIKFCKWIVSNKYCAVTEGKFIGFYKLKKCFFHFAALLNSVPARPRKYHREGSRFLLPASGTC